MQTSFGENISHEVSEDVMQYVPQHNSSATTDVVVSSSSSVVQPVTRSHKVKKAPAWMNDFVTVHLNHLLLMRRIFPLEMLYPLYS